MTREARPDSIDLLRQDVESHARMITEISKEQQEVHKVLQELKTDREVRKERDKQVIARFNSLDEGLKNIQSLGRYILFAFISTLIAALVTFIVKGGLNVPTL